MKLRTPWKGSFTFHLRFCMLLFTFTLTKILYPKSIQQDSNKNCARNWSFLITPWRVFLISKKSYATSRCGRIWVDSSPSEWHGVTRRGLATPRATGSWAWRSKSTCTREGFRKILTANGIKEHWNMLDCAEVSSLAFIVSSIPQRSSWNSIWASTIKKSHGLLVQHLCPKPFIALKRIIVCHSLEFVGSEDVSGTRFELFWCDCQHKAKLYSICFRLQR